MPSWRKLVSKFTATATAAVLLLTSCAVALGQEAEPASDDKSGWVLGYALVLLAIALGLVAVCRPGRRTAEVKIVEE